MKNPLRSLLLVLSTSIVAPFASAMTAQPVPAETLVARLSEAISLTSDQKEKITAIIQKQNDAIQALPPGKASDPQSEVDYMQRVFTLRSTARAEVRALLMPEQQKKYDHISQIRGGGQTQNSSNRVAQLDAQVGLTEAQKKLAAEIYDEEYEELLAFAPEERPVKGQQVRQSTKALIQAMLTPEQQQKITAARQAEAKHANDERKEIQLLLNNNASLVARLGRIKHLEPSTSFISENGQLRSGKTVYKVVGESGSETWTVYWEKPSIAAQIKITKLEGPNREAIQP
ncbi:MAG: hypothetical protein QM790_06490 [Nibricoccus sp.]